MEHSSPALSMQVLTGVTGALVRSARPKQWTKNLLVFLALFFTVNEAWSPSDASELLSLTARSSLAFLIFSCLTSAAYLVNDIFDIEKDRGHPKKRLRPIASGQLSAFTAWAAAAALGVGGLLAAFLLEPRFGLTSLAYIAIMIAYTLVLKQIILLDVLTITAGFVLRAVAGAAVIQVPVSLWLYVCAGLGALFIALAKRRGELAQAGANARDQRDTLAWYSVAKLDRMIALVAASVLLTYSLYTAFASNLPENRTMMLTIPFVVYGLLRYLYLVRARGLGENPEDIVLTDLPLVAAIASWLATAATILLVFRG